jgi:mannose-6-phosphate isomerase-like protein (cupin superfamily)
MYHANIEHAAKLNTDFRHVLFTTPKSQLVLMSLNVGEEIGEEVHPENDQIFFIIDGRAEVTVDGQTITLDDDAVLVVPAGARHNICSVGDEPLKLCTIYTPPNHPDGTIHHTMADADQAEAMMHNHVAA